MDGRSDLAVDEGAALLAAVEAAVASLIEAQSETVFTKMRYHRDTLANLPTHACRTEWRFPSWTLVSEISRYESFVNGVWHVTVTKPNGTVHTLTSSVWPEQKLLAMLEPHLLLNPFELALVHEMFKTACVTTVDKAEAKLKTMAYTSPRYR